MKTASDKKREHDELLAAELKDVLKWIDEWIEVADRVCMQDEGFRLIKYPQSGERFLPSFWTWKKVLWPEARQKLVEHIKLRDTEEVKFNVYFSENHEKLFVSY